jgi:hypothetical protein
VELGDRSQDGRFVTIGGPIDRSRVALIVYGEDLDPDKRTARTGIEPTGSHRKGDSTRSTHRHPNLRYPRGMWRVDSPLPRNAHFEDHLERLLDIVEPAIPVWRQLADQEMEIRLSCGLFLDRFNRGAELPARTMQRLGALGVRLGLDIYCCEVSVQPSP